MITIVTAPGRSGTSLTMQMLQAAGLPLYWNRLPNRTSINPHGHYEIDRYEWDDEYAEWLLNEAEGKVVKLFPYMLSWLNYATHDYQFITILRSPEEIRRSHVDMLQSEKRHHELTTYQNTDAGLLRDGIRDTHDYVTDIISPHPHLILSFNELFTGKAQHTLGRFLHFDQLQIRKMQDCVQPDLRHYWKGEE